LYPKEDNAVELECLFVEERIIGEDTGKKLWQHAIQTAREQGFEQMFINSDPHTEDFYYAMGAMRIGQSESAIMPGRMLPLMQFNLVEEK